MAAFNIDTVSNPDIESINSKWGIQRNNLVENNSVDAAAVIDDQITYLFSVDQYVRYSTEDYRFVDEGCPKLIVENLRQEQGFKNLPESFDQDLQTLANEMNEKPGFAIPGLVSQLDAAVQVKTDNTSKL